MTCLLAIFTLVGKWFAFRLRQSASPGWYCVTHPPPDEVTAKRPEMFRRVDNDSTSFQRSKWNPKGILYQNRKEGCVDRHVES